MYDIPPEALRALQEAEEKLRSLIVEAARGGRYDEVSAVTTISAKLHSLIQDARPGSLIEPVRASEPSFPLEESEKRSEPSVPRSSPRENRAQKTNGYPQFRIRDAQLVKLGWSAGNNQEYEHRVPREGVDAVVRYLSSLKKNRFPVTGEAIARALQKEDESQVLGYQVYVVTAWLRSLGLLRPNGRQGYHLADEKDLPEAVASVWEKLVRSRE